MVSAFPFRVDASYTYYDFPHETHTHDGEENESRARE